MDRKRRLAVRCLIETEKGGYSNLIFKEQTRDIDADRRDILFATVLFYGTLEKKLTLDYILSRYVSKSLSSLDTEVLCILRSGLYQALFMDSVPVSAAVNESAALCSDFKKTSAKGFVNAVLRKAADFDLSKIDRLPDNTGGLSVKYSVCGELAALFKKQYGADAKSILSAFYNKSGTAVRVNTLKTTADEVIKQLAEDGVTAKTTALDGALVILSGDFLSSRAFKEGHIRVQSLAAQSAVEALAVEPKQRLLDMCAAPGGKTLTAAQLMKNDGEIIATDCYESRVKLIEAQMKAEGISIVKAEVADATEYRAKALFDRVLCDVPCSAYGEIASKPELRYKAPPTDGELYALQAHILENGAENLKKGGRLVYSTCTLNKEENEKIAASFLREHEDFRAVLPELSLKFIQTDEKFAYFLPDSQKNEGFFIATFERI